MQNFNTLSEALQSAAERGYQDSFRMHEKCLRCIETGKEFRFDEVRIVEYHRFEDDSCADDTSILYVIRCSDGSGGCVIDSYSVYADGELSEFMRQVHGV